MLSDPKRLRTNRSHGYLVSWKHRFRIGSDAEAAKLVERLLGDPRNIDALREGLGRPEATQAEIVEWLVTGLASGGLQLLKTKVKPPAFDTPEITHLRPDDEKPKKPDIERPTWISLEIVREDGAPLPGLATTLTSPDGSTRDAKLDADSRFRADDIPRGDGGCTLVLRADGGQVGPTTTPTNEDDVLVDSGVPFRVTLATARHHRLVVVEGRTEIVLVDSAGKPVENARCRVLVDGRTRHGLTDRNGVWVAQHLRTAEVCGVTFPDLDREAWELQDSQKGTREPHG